jgi:hypothetical protein
MVVQVIRNDGSMKYFAEKEVTIKQLVWAELAGIAEPDLCSAVSNANVGTGFGEPCLLPGTWGLDCEVRF